VTRYEKAKPIEEEAPVHMQRSYYDFVEAQIVDHLTSSSSLNGPMKSGRTAMDTVFDTVIDGHISIGECIKLVEFLVDEKCTITNEEGGKLLLNKVLRCTTMRLKDKVDLGEYLLENKNGPSERTQLEKETRLQ